ncbi:hypothetical protein LXA43DRAFT_1017743 [Ganoderma leucocontextum]|nr:hypothetical protein LXA43DRAFT_1017743 [Ganoderma leucocontextum]
MSAAVGLNTIPPEVLRNICARLLREPPENNGQKWPNRKERYVGLSAVLALTRTSRTFHEHAINALWDTLPGYGCLVFTLPPDAWTIEEKPHRNRWSDGKTELHLSIVRPLVDADFLRFQHYAPRVKRILSDSHAVKTFPPHVWSHLCQTSILDAFSTYFSINDHTPFPNLSVLHLSPKAEDPATYYRALPIFFGQNLRNIADKCQIIKQQMDLSIYDWMLSKMQEKCPDLLFFNAFYSPWFNAMATALSNALPSFRQLISVQVTLIPLTPQAVLHLATLPNLTDVGFKIDDSCDAESLALFTNTSSKDYFHKLRTFSLVHQRNAAVPNAVMRSVSSPAVHIIRISVHYWEIPVEEVKDLLYTIANRPGYNRLRSVSVSVHGVAEKDGTIREEDLMPFYKLKNIVDLELTIQARFAVTNEMLRSMASSWRKIRRLHLGLGPGCSAWRTDDDAEPLASLGGLISFAHLCPHLHTLALSVRPVLSSAHADVRPSLGRPHRALQGLNVGYSKIEEKQVLPTAVFLSDVFPKVDIDCDWAFEENAWEDEELTEADRDEILAEAVYRDRWNRVTWHLVPALAKVRKQERKWGLANGMTIPTPQVFREE